MEDEELLCKLKNNNPVAYRHIMGLVAYLVRSQEPPIMITQARRIDLPALEMEEKKHGT